MTASWSLAQQGEVIHNVNLRKDPYTKNPPKRLLTPPEVVTLLEPRKTAGYYHVQTGQGENGWVWSPNVQVIQATPTPTPVPSTSLRSLGDRNRLRQLPMTPCVGLYRWNWSVSLYEVLNLLLVLLTLLAIVKYTFESSKIRRATNEQAEAAQKPCVRVIAEVIGLLPNFFSVDLAKRPPYATELPRGQFNRLELENIGNGPALNPRYVLEKRSVGRWEDANASGEIGSLKVGETTPCPLMVVDPYLRHGEFRVTVNFESMSGTRYGTRQYIGDGVLTHFDFKAWDEKLGSFPFLEPSLP